MNTKSEIGRSITKGDIILIVSLIVISLVMFVLSFSGSENLVAEIYVDGERAHSIALSEVTESYTVNENYCQLLIEKDGVSFVFSDCGDKLCIKRGKLKNQGDTMACVPQKVVVILKADGKEKIDGVAY
ncbi:MAG: NusG domain II-containing protein [Clostridia bacterium]|nr:NusG domain II-containing protein [Clostridia bacterium]MBO7319898.1 NusG domain II-containing protein [Clostridia bacterium]